MKFAVIVAGGKGLRMGADLPKQFIPIAGRPVLMHTIQAFHTYDSSIQIVLVLPQDQQGYWSELCKQYCFEVPHRVACGGATRFHSVQNGLAVALQGHAEAALSDTPDLVAVHDGVRPFVSAEVLDRCFTIAAEKGAVVPVVPVVETVRQLTAAGSVTVPRDDYRLVQTPQVFTADLLQKAYRQPYTEAFTDDASVVEAMGCTVTLTEGNRENIKLTTPFDLTIAQALLQPCSI